MMASLNMTISSRQRNAIDFLGRISSQYNLNRITDWILQLPDFVIQSGSGHPHQHHYGDGGLIQHTYEVVKLCLNNADLLYDFSPYPINKRVLFAAALFHDVGKLYDYEKINDIWQPTEHKRKIHHISRSALEWERAVVDTKTCRDIFDDVLHCILSHHGAREWGSPISPKSREAWILFLCDNLSARAYDCDTNDVFTKK